MACFPLREPSFAALADAPVYFRYGSNRRRVLVDARSASAVLSVHAACNPEHQAKIERMVAGSLEQLKRVIGFSIDVCRAHREDA